MSAPESSDHGTERSGVFWGISAYLLWGLVTIYWKALKHFNAFELIGYRITTSALLMGAWLVSRGQTRSLLAKLRDRAVLVRVAIGAIVLSINWTTYVWAVVHGRVMETALGYFMTPIGLTLLGVMVLHEHLRIVQKVALALAVAAMVVLTVGYGQFPWVSLLIACSWVTYSYLKKQGTLNAFESLTTETLILFVPAVGLVVWGSTRAESIVNTATSTEWILVALTGIVTAVPLLMFALAAKRLPLSVLALVQYIVPTINFLLGWLVYDETLTLVRVAGFVLVWIGLIAVTIDSMNRALLAS